MTGICMMCRRRTILSFLVLLLLQTRMALAQQLGLGHDDGVDFMRVGLALAACLAVAVAAALLLRKRLRGGPILRPMRTSRRLQIEESLRVGTQADICIVSCDGEEMLVSSSPHGVKLLRNLGPKRDAVSP